VAERMVAEGNIRVARAREILSELALEATHQR